MSAVKASPPLDPLDYLARCERAAALRGFRVDRYGEVELRTAETASSERLDVAGAAPSAPLIALTRRTRGVRPRIYLSSGIHGDEPAAPEALMQLIEMGVFDHRATWWLVPLLNPLGFQLRTRENADAIDLNRDYLMRRAAEVRAHVRWLEAQPAFDLGICLHEDWEATGFYLYELNPEEGPSLAAAMLQAARLHMPIDPAAMIDGRPVAEPGVLRPDHDPALRDLWAEAIYLRAHHTRLVYTIETPSAAPLAQRVATLTTAVRAGLDAFFQP